MIRLIPAVGDIYCVFVEKLQKYTACQVTSFKESESGKSSKLISLLELDWLSDTLPDDAELLTMKPLSCDFYFWNNNLQHSYVEAAVPKDYIKAGNIPPLLPGETNSYGTWNVGGSIYRQWQWEQIPAEKRQLFKQAAKDDALITLGTRSLRRSTNVVWEDMLAELDDVSELEKLPCLTKIHAAEASASLLAFVKNNPFIIELHLGKTLMSSIDLSGSQIRKLFIQNAQGLEKLTLNKGLTNLTIGSDISPDLHIEADEDGYWLSAGFTSSPPDFHGLPRLSGLHLHQVTELDLLPIVQRFPELQEMRLWGKPGTISNLDSISQLSKLASFSTYDIFGFSADQFPPPQQLPRLSTLWMTSLPADAAKSIKTAYKQESKRGLNLSITKPRNPEWLANNLTNPFRDWDGRENITAAQAKKAADQYKKTATALTALQKQDSELPKAADLEAALLELVAAYTLAFNKMDRRTGFIETVEREEIYVVLHDLLDSTKQSLAAQGLAIDLAPLFERFDQLRDF
ncbi:hypothetical protein [Brevibacillus parabrevis]|uniref:hypothetical protein n=1 Tax=Brevibacillus parabrevis TaxID=54914 RepID=UPI001F611E2D|nr:hypothetical protein [Brevibacillus parabrevis]